MCARLTLTMIGMAAICSFAALTHAAEPLPLPKPSLSGLKNPTGVCIGADKRIYITVAGEFGKDGDGAVLFINEKGSTGQFATGLDDPSAIAAYQDFLFVADKQKIVRVNKKGDVELWCPASAFPYTPKVLNDIIVDPESGTLYVSSTDQPPDRPRFGSKGSIFRISPKKNVDILAVANKVGPRNDDNSLFATGLALDGASHLLAVNGGMVRVERIKLADGSRASVTAGRLDDGCVTIDKFGRLFTGDMRDGRIYAFPRPIEDFPVSNVPDAAMGIEMASLGEGVYGMCVDATSRSLLVVATKPGVLYSLPIHIPGWEVDDAPLPIETSFAFPELKFAGWKDAEESGGKVVPLRPIVLTHAGDGSHRNFVATEQGVIHVFPNDDKAKETKIFLDIQKQVVYDDKQNEEGLLGLAFHPKYKENGEFFVFYTTTAQKKTNVLSRFHVSKDDPNRADPASEEIILKIEDRPFWNHDGGTVCFGPDGFLYLCTGDGGLGNDPFENAQNLKSLLGKVLRIDVDHKDPGKNYAIPKDNPFVNDEKHKDARGEIWAYGLRNIWRMAFDRETKRLWAGDVGQNLYEEIDLIEKGGNYGWNLREGLHPFGARGVGPRKDLIDPIWEYHHDLGKCIVGGCVYRGKNRPELEGRYLYADYISGRLWALRYDEGKKRVTENHPLRDHGVQVISFGEDEQGEVFALAVSNTGQGIFRLTKAADK